jgi:retinol dehydrogenase-12
MFDQNSVPDQAGKMFIVTGSTSGVGMLLVEILYTRNAKVYVAARSEDKAKRTISLIQSQNPKSHGQLIFL